jgi:hypothetical protein
VLLSISIICIPHDCVSDGGMKRWKEFLRSVGGECWRRMLICKGSRQRREEDISAIFALQHRYEVSGSIGLGLKNIFIRIRNPSR